MSSETPSSQPGPTPQQQEGIEFLRGRGRALLADPPGFGKSLQALRAAEGRTLIMGPAYLRGTWVEEVAKWRPDLDWEWVPYTSLCARVADSKGRMTKVTARLRDDLAGRWDTTIADECHYLKRSGSGEATYVKVAQQISTERLYMLTGTPLPNWPHDIQVALKLLFPGDRRFTNYWNWVRSWFEVWQPPYGGWKIRDCTCGGGKEGPHEVEWCGLLPGLTWDRFWLENEMSGPQGRMLRRPDPDLPPMAEQRIDCPMEPAQAKAYRDLKKEYYAWVEETGTEVVAWSDGGKHTKLAQVCTGLATVDPQWSGPGGSGKMTVLRSLLADRGPGQVVFCLFRASAQVVHRLCTDLGMSAGLWMGGMRQADRDAMRAQFQTGSLDILIGTIDAMAEGVNLQRAHTTIFVERSYRPYKNEQARRRVWRHGQDKPVTIVDLVTPKTVDERILRVCLGKERLQVDSMRAGDFANML